MKTTTVKIDGVDYLIDLAKAKQLGLITQDYPLVKSTSLEIGNVYQHRKSDGTVGGEKIVIIRSWNKTGKCWHCYGCWGDWRPWSNAPEGYTEQELLDYLNKSDYRWVQTGNVAKQFAAVLKAI